MSFSQIERLTTTYYYNPIQDQIKRLITIYYYNPIQHESKYDLFIIVM